MRTNIRAIKENTEINGCYLIQSSAIGMSRKGQPYLHGTLKDATGQIPYKLWNYDKTPPKNNSVVCVKGVATRFQNNLTLILSDLTEPENVDAGMDLGQMEEKDPKIIACQKTLHELIDSIEDKDYKTVVRAILADESIMRAAAAQSIHHAYRYGMLIHTVNIMQLADCACRQYPFLNRSLLLAAAALHDIGKPKMTYQINALDLAEGYTEEGHLIGHLVGGAMLIHDAAKEIPKEKATLLMHCILSHHGIPQWGAAVLPVVPEADLLAKLDAADAAMETFRETLQGMDPKSFSQPVRGLDGRCIYKA